MSDAPEKKLIDTQSIFEALKNAGAVKNCPRCDNETYKLLSGMFVHSLQTDTRSIQFGGSGLPTWVLICDRCGFVSQHAVEILSGVTDIEPVRH